MGKRYVIRLTGPERATVAQLANDGVQPLRVRLWAAIVLAASDGACDQEIATQLATSVATVQRTRRRFVLEGLASIERTPTRARAPIVLGTRSWVQEVLRRVRGMSGVRRAALLDWERCACVGQVGTRDGAWCTEATALFQAVLQTLPANERLENVAITGPTHYQLFQVLSPAAPMVLNVLVNRHEGNLALARHEMETIALSIVD